MKIQILWTRIEAEVQGNLLYLKGQRNTEKITDLLLVQSDLERFQQEFLTVSLILRNSHQNSIIFWTNNAYNLMWLKTFYVGVNFHSVKEWVLYYINI